MNYLNNIARIKAVAEGLKELENEIVFVGGAVVSLYCERPDLIDLRVTDDVDVIVQIQTRGKYMMLQEKLRA